MATIPNTQRTRIASTAFAAQASAQPVPQCHNDAFVKTRRKKQAVCFYIVRPFFKNLYKFRGIPYFLRL